MHPHLDARSTSSPIPVLVSVIVLLGSACSLPASLAGQTPAVAPSETRAPVEACAPTETLAPRPTREPTLAPTSEPAAAPTATLLGLEIVEWSVFPYANLADPANTDTHVEVLIRNPNDVPVRVLDGGAELKKSRACRT